MGAMKLEFRSPKMVEGIALDPQPDWSFDNLLLELNSIEEKLNVKSSPFTKTQSRELPARRGIDRASKGFVMHVPDDVMDDTDTEEDITTELELVGSRFACDDLYMSDDGSDNELALPIQPQLMDPVGVVEAALFEINREHHLSVTDEVRNRISALEAVLSHENEKFASTLEQVGKRTEVKRDMDKKLDMQYQRRVAEALDNHLTAVQRDHEQRSQIEERRIRDDAAREEARRREKALQDEKARQERLKAEAERQARLGAERVKAEKAAAEEAERKAAKEAAEKNASQTSIKPAAGPTEISQKKIEPSISQPNASKNLQPGGTIIRGAESALKLEERRLQIYKEVAAQNEALGLGSNKEYWKHEMQIARRIKTISGTMQSVRAKANEIIKLISDPSYPQSISISMFAEKFVSLCANPTGSFNSTVYAYARVVVMVTSKIPLAMDILIAKLNRACIFSVPKYISYSKSVFDSKEAYFKAIGYLTEDGTIESTDNYLKRMSSYMKLYGAIVQMEGEGFPNLHGLVEGWAWLSRFLNSLPANLYTATALLSFVEMAGYALFKRYKLQFIKLISIIEQDFLKALKGREDPNMSKVIANLQNYIEERKFQVEPEGRQLKTSLESHDFVPDAHWQ